MKKIQGTQNFKVRPFLRHEHESGQWAGRKEVEMAFHREILLILSSESQRQMSFMKQLHVCGG